MKKLFESKGAKRLLSLALSIVMVLSLLPAGALAEEGEITPRPAPVRLPARRRQSIRPARCARRTRPSAP